MTDHDRTLEFEIEVPGTPEEVWRAIATAREISSWYVPHEFEERAGAPATASFGEGPQMQIDGRVAAYEPPHRIVFDSGDGVPGLAFEWLVEARDGGSCVVRLVNSGFGTGEEWDAQYDGLKEGWPLFLRNLQLHLTHFPGRTATSVLPMAAWPGSREEVWARLTDELGIPARPETGSRLVLRAADSPTLAGTALDVADHRLALLVDEPAPGTAFVAAEGDGDGCGVSIWSYLYDDAGAVAARRDRPAWQRWLTERSAS